MSSHVDLWSHTKIGVEETFWVGIGLRNFKGFSWSTVTVVHEQLINYSLNPWYPPPHTHTVLTSEAEKDLTRLPGLVCIHACYKANRLNNFHKTCHAPATQISFRKGVCLLKSCVCNVIPPVMVSWSHGALGLSLTSSSSTQLYLYAFRVIP